MARPYSPPGAKTLRAGTKPRDEQMEQQRLPDWESQMIDDMIEAAERRRQTERLAAK